MSDDADIIWANTSDKTDLREYVHDGKVHEERFIPSDSTPYSTQPVLPNTVCDWPTYGVNQWC